jgi:allantoin racemase
VAAAPPCGAALTALSMRLLVINPNTTAAVTQLLQRRIASLAGAAVQVDATTARFGSAYIADESSYAIGAHAALDAYAAHVYAGVKPDAVLLGCFGDPGVWALREVAGVPVIGLAEAAMREASDIGRYSIVTGGAAWKPMLERLARSLELDGLLTRVVTVAPTAAQLAAHPAMGQALLADACREAAGDADAVIVGGAALAGMAALLQGEVPVPLIDSVDAGARAVVRDVGLA